MSEARCPRCNEPIRLPEPLPAADASGRCPWCQETFALHEMLDQLPPMLQIVDAGSETTEIDDESAASYLDDDSDTAFMLRDEEPTTPAARPSPAFHATPRRQKKSSPVKTVLQIVGGGLVSIPLAIGILLLLKYFGVANPNLGIPLLDGKAFDRQMTATEPRPLSEESRQREPGQGGRLLSDDMPEFGELDTETDESEQIGDTVDAEPEQPSEMPDPSSGSGESLPSDDSTTPEEAEDLLSIAPTEIASPLSSSTGEDVADASAPENSDVESVVATAKQASAALADHSDPATRSGALKDLYLELAKLGEAASPAQQESYTELFSQLRGHDQLELMGSFGEPWFSAPSRLYEGIFATGTLEQDGDGYQFHWEDGESVPVGGWESYPDDPSNFAGKKVALLAKIDTAAEPRRFLIGYLERLDRGSEDSERP